MKYSGMAGFSSSSEQVRPGVFKNKIVTYRVVGDVLNYGYNYQQSNNKVINDIRTTNRLSLLLTPHLRKHIGELVWLEFMGDKWRVDSFNIQSPRAIITLGGLYND